MRGYLSLVLVVLSFLSFGLGPACAEPRTITHRDIWTMKRTGHPSVSPDGRMIAAVVTSPDYENNKDLTDIWLIPVDGTTPRMAVQGLKISGPLQWSPDGTRLAFSAKAEGEKLAQIYVYDVGGAEAPKRITDRPTGARAARWRPDGTGLLFESEEELSAERKAQKSHARIYDAMPVRFWNQWLDNRHPHVFVIDLTPGASPRDLFDGLKFAKSPGFRGRFNSEGGGEDLQAIWTPDGAGIVFSAVMNADQMMRVETPNALYHLSLEGGEPRRLTDLAARYGQAQFNKSGTALIALMAVNGRAKGPLATPQRLVRLNWPNMDRPQILTADFDRSPDGFALSDDDTTIYFSAEDDGFHQLFKVSALGGRVARLFKVDHGSYSNVEPTASGLVAMFQTAARPGELVRLGDMPGSHTALTDFNGAIASELAVTEPVHFWFKAKDGRQVHSIMFLPPNFDGSKKYPLLVFPHGGPAGMSTDSFSTRWNSHLLASPGYVVLETNYMGSTGFGADFADAVERDVLDGPGHELLEAIDVASTRYRYIDTTRMCAAGASYGGYIMNWFNGHTNRFKCLVSHAGAINNESQYGVNDGGIEREWRMGGPIWEKGGQWNRQSPIRYAQNFKTPTLITQGENDFRVPLGESLTLFKILQRRQIASRLIVFPDTGHWVLKPEDSRLHMEQVLSWLNLYLDK